MSLTLLRGRSQESPPEKIVKSSPSGKVHVSEHAPVPYIPDSRAMSLMTEREVDRYIRRVLRHRAELRSAEKSLGRGYVLKEIGLGRHRRFVPALAGGAQAPNYQQGIQSTPATAAGPPAIPFDQAAKRGIEPGPSFESTPGAGTINLGVQPLPAQGYLRAVEIDVKTSAEGETAEGELLADYPFNIIETYRFQDTNGNQIDDLPGFVLWADNLFGGYAGCPDPRIDPDYNGVAGKTSFQTMLVRELAPNGFGSIANLSASQAYKLTLKIAPLTGIFKKNPKKAPTFNVSVWMHFWQLPEPVSLDGRPQVQTPPYHGTTQYRWFAPTGITAGAINLKIEQTGNEIRNIILIGREKEGIRTNAVFPEPFQLRWDTEFLLLSGLRQLRKIARELTNDQALGGAAVNVATETKYPTGCVVLPFNFGEGRFVGGSGVNSWLPTVTGTRLQVTGNQEAATAGEIGVYVNDVSVAETAPALRPVAHGPGGYTPQVAPRVPGAA